MNRYIVISLFLGIAITTYFYLIYQNNYSQVFQNNNFGTISNSLGSPLLGSSDARLTLIVFGNYQCIDCQKWFNETRPQIVSNYIDSGKINMFFIDTYPKTSKFYKTSIASYCADEQGKYWKYHEKLFLNFSNNLDFDQHKELALKVGLDMDVFVNCLESGKYDKKIKYSSFEAQKNGINQIPSFIIIGTSENYEKIDGFQSFSYFEKKINLLYNNEK